MLRKLWIAMGFIFPTVTDAVRRRQASTRIGYTSYCVMNRAGFAEAFTHHLHEYRNASDSLAVLNKHKHEDVAAKAQRMEYPCVDIPEYAAKLLRKMYAVAQGKIDDTIGKAIIRMVDTTGTKNVPSVL